MAGNETKKWLIRVYFKGPSIPCLETFFFPTRNDQKGDVIISGF